VLVHGTPFPLLVPASVQRPGDTGESVWVQWPDSVLESEDALE